MAQGAGLLERTAGRRGACSTPPARALWPGRAPGSDSSTLYGTIQSLVMEIVLTFLLVTVILGTATNHKLTGHNAPIAVGATIALAALFAYPVSGASMNPARSLGPFLVSGQFVAAWWIYLVGPLAGALLAVVMAWLLRGRTTREAGETARGA